MASRTKKQAKPVPSGLWFAFCVIIAVFLWWFGLPCMPAVWLGLLVGGLTAQYPASKRKTDPVDENKLAVYRKWKDRLAGLNPIEGGKPAKLWTGVWRVCWWAAWLPGLFLSARSAYWWTLVLNLLFGFMTVLAFVRASDRKKDRRHPYTGVSLKACAENNKTLFFVTLGVSLFLSVALECFAYLGFFSWMVGIASPLSLSLMVVTFACRKNQTATWKRQVEWQQRLDGWINAEDSPMAKPWRNAYLSQVDILGEDEQQLVILRVRFKQGIDEVTRAGIDAVRPMVTEDGWNWSLILGAKQRKQGQDMFAPNSIRLLLGKDESCIPDVRLKKAGAKTATLAADIAYGLTAESWHKRAPLVKAVDVSAEEGDEARAAWLLTFTTPPSGGEDIHRIGLDWLGNDPNPETFLKMPLLVDLYDCFHLAAEPDVPLSDEGNKYRQKDGVTNGKRFQDYMDVSRRFKNEQTIWADIIPSKLRPPSPVYDGERVFEADGWTETALPLSLSAPATANDYARLDLTPLDPTARFVGVLANGTDMVLVTTTGANAPARLGDLTGSKPQQRMLAEAMILRAVLAAMGSKGTVTVADCTNEGRDVALWHANLTVSDGATIADIRKKTANIQSMVGVDHLLWDWKSAGTAVIWLMDELPIGVEEIGKWKRRSRQKELIQLVLSDSWGVAGVTNPSGKSPVVVGMGVLPRNQSVIKSRFRIPAGLSLTRAVSNQEKFLLAAGYQYGRILDRGDEHESDMFDMILAKSSPFPETVDADWDYAKQCGECAFPLGVDDLGEIVEWNVKHTPHIVVMGKSGTGKSSAAQIIVAEALMRGYELFIIDPKKGAVDFTQWAKPHARAFIQNRQSREAEAVVKWVEDEMNRRVNVLNKYGLGDIADLPDDVRPKRILLFWDEFNSYLGDVSATTPNPNQDIELANANAAINATNNSIRRTMSALAAIALQGRTAGIHIVLAGQRLSIKDFEKFNNGKAFFETLGRLLLGSIKVEGVVNSVTEAHRLQESMKNSKGELPRGRGLYESVEAKLSSVQTWFSGKQSALKELTDSLPATEPIDYAPFMPQEAAQYGQVKQEELEQLQELEPTITQEDIEQAEELDW